MQPRLLLLWLLLHRTVCLHLLHRCTAVLFTFTVKQYNLLQLLLPSCIRLAGSIKPRTQPASDTISLLLGCMLLLSSTVITSSSSRWLLLQER
jgi:hypothetical protein